MLIGALHSFVSTVDAQRELLSAVTDRRLTHLEVANFSGGLVAAADHYRASDTPEILVIELAPQDSLEAITAHLGDLAEQCDAGTAVILLGWINDIDWFRALTALGVADYLCLPTPPHRLAQSIANALDRDLDGAAGQVTAVMGASGGAGASSVALELAHYFRREGQPSPLLADFDFAFGSQDIFSDVEGREAVRAALADTNSTDISLLAKLALPTKGIRLLCAPPHLKLAEGVPSLEMVRQFCRVSRRLASHTIIDLPHGWSPPVREALRLADEIVLVAAPTLSGFRNLRALLVACEGLRSNELPPRVLINRVSPNFARSDFGRQYIGALSATRTALARDCGREIERAHAAAASLAPQATLPAAVRQLMGGGPASAKTAAPSPGLLKRFLLRRSPA